MQGMPGGKLSNFNILTFYFNLLYDICLMKVMLYYVINAVIHKPIPVWLSCTRKTEKMAKEIHVTVRENTENLEIWKNFVCISHKFSDSKDQGYLLQNFPIFS